MLLDVSSEDAWTDQSFVSLNDDVRVLFSMTTRKREERRGVSRVIAEYQMNVSNLGTLGRINWSFVVELGFRGGISRDALVGLISQ